MSKDFDKWNKYQQKIHKSDRSILCKPGSVWWCALGINIGHEQDGDHESFERPVLIIRTFSNDTCLCIPMTTSKNISPFCKTVTLLEKDIYAITSQMRTLSNKRLLRELGALSNSDFKMIKNTIHATISEKI